MPDKPNRIGWRGALASVRDPLIYKNFAIHAFVLLPATIVLALLALRIDHHVGWGVIAPWPWRLVLAAVSFAVGAAVVVYSYAYLLALGEGSPGSHLGGPQRLVTTGPYALVRHPSVIGKLLGVIAVGLVFGSPTFLLIVIPLLLAYSLVTNRLIQERYCERAFGDGYRSYRRAVPMIIPRPAAVWTRLRGRPVVIEIEADVAHPAAIPRFELAIYLVLLAGILLLALAVVVLLTGGVG